MATAATAPRLAQRVSEPAARTFDAVYQAQHKRVYALALRLLCDASAAEDATQDVFVAVWRGLADFRGESALSTWIHTITVRTATRRWGGHREDQLDAAALERYERAAVRAFPDTRLALERAVATLPRGARSVLLLHDVYGHTQAEVADMLGIAVGTVKAQLHRARNLMKEALA